MKTPLVLFFAFLISVASAAEPASAGASVDRDVDNMVFTDASPLDIAAKAAMSNPVAESIAAKETAAKVKPVPPPAARNLTAPNQEITMSTLPPAALNAVTQIGGSDFVFEATPIDEAVKLISRQLDRAVHIAVGRNYHVTGVWKQAHGVDVLRDVAHNFGLVFKETPQAYLIEEPSRAIFAPAGIVRAGPKKPKTEPLPASLFADEVIQSVVPVSARYQKQVTQTIAEQQKAALRARADLEADLR